jgi:hypothetical protein
VLGSNSRRLLDPEHRKNAKVSITQWAVINALDLSFGGIPMGSIYRGG